MIPSHPISSFPLMIKKTTVATPFFFSSLVCFLNTHFFPSVHTYTCHVIRTTTSFISFFFSICVYALFLIPFFFSFFFLWGGEGVYLVCWCILVFSPFDKKKNHSFYYVCYVVGIALQIYLEAHSYMSTHHPFFVFCFLLIWFMYLFHIYIEDFFTPVYHRVVKGLVLFTSSIRDDHGPLNSRLTCHVPIKQGQILWNTIN